MAGRNNFPSNIERKQKEAIARQVAYDKLSNEEKLARLDRANLTAARERARLNYRIAKAASTQK